LILFAFAGLVSTFCFFVADFVAGFVAIFRPGLTPVFDFAAALVEVLVEVLCFLVDVAACAGQGVATDSAIMDNVSAHAARRIRWSGLNNTLARVMSS
jgi:hypothetical protein